MMHEQTKTITRIRYHYLSMSENTVGWYIYSYDTPYAGIRITGNRAVKVGDYCKV